MFEHRDTTIGAITAWYQAVMGSGSSQVAAAVGNMDLAVYTWLQSINAVRTSLATHQDVLLDAQTATTLAIFESDLNQLRQDLTILSRTMPLLEDFANQDSYTLALSLVDNRVLRSGGGLITGATILDFNAGRLTDYEFLTLDEITTGIGGDVLLPASLLEVAPDTPASYAQLLWDIDTITDATQAASLLERAIERPVSGFAVHTAITNERSLWQDFSSDDAGVVQVAFHDYFTTLSPTTATNFLLGLVRALDNRDFYWFSFDNDLGLRLAELGFSNRPTTPTCPAGLGGDVCLLETFYQVDTSLDYTFNNTYVTRGITHNIDLFPTHVDHERTIVYNNTHPTADYLAYIRFLLPAEANAVVATINGFPADLDASSGLLLTVPTNDTAVIRLTFTTHHDVSHGDFTYSFFNQRQPGVINSDLAVNVRNGTPFNARRIAPTATVDGRRFRFALPETGDFLLGVAF
jgi:hypothetical protein